MPIYPPQDRAQLAGMPGQWSDSAIGAHEHLFAGDTPLHVMLDLPLALDQTLPAYTPVAYNEAGTGLVAAEEGTPAIGITQYDIVVPATGDMPGHPVIVAACFNIAALNWDASYDTDAKKFSAFDGAPAPTNCTVRRVYRGSVVAQP